MKKNIHSFERAVRIVAGAIIASMAFWGPTNMWFLLGPCSDGYRNHGLVPTLCTVRDKHLQYWQKII